MLIYVFFLDLLKHQEKEADLHTCRQLVVLGYTDIVNARIKDLHRSGSASGNIWWFFDIEQAEYLERVIK